MFFLVFWGLGSYGFYAISVTYMVLTSDTMYLSLITCHALFSKKPKWFFDLVMSICYGFLALKVMLLD
jgi:hypothetical protein